MVLRDRALRRLAPLFRREELPRAALFAASTNALNAGLNLQFVPAAISTVATVVVALAYARVDWKAVSEEVADGA